MTPLGRVSILDKLVNIPYYWVLGMSAQHLIYTSNEDGAYAIWSIEPTSGKKKRLTGAPLPFMAGSNVARPLQSSSRIFFARDMARGAEQSQVFGVDSQRDDVEESLLSDTPPLRILGLAMISERQVGFVGASAADVSLYLAGESGYDKMSKIGGMPFVSDANQDYVVGSGALNRNPKSEELFIFEIATGRLQVYTPKEGSINRAPRLNGSKLLFESNHQGKNRLCIYDVLSGELSPVRFSSQEYEVTDPVEDLFWGWLLSQRVWAVGKRNGEAGLFVDGRSIQTPPGFVWGVTFADSMAYYSHSTLVSPPRILSTNLHTGANSLVVENTIPPAIAEKLGRSYFAKFRSKDNFTIPAYVLEAAEPVGKGAVLYIHGGPTSEVANSWSVLTACFAILGYHMIAPNFRGSTGYGDEFKLANIGDLGGGDLEDMVSSVRWAIDTGLADRFAVVGYSYGGYSTLLALGKHPDLFNCGVAGASIADWEEQYELSDAAFKNIIDLLFNYRKELLKERSPITYVQNVRVPLCLFQAQNDTRTPLAPVLRYVQRLPKDVPFELHVKPDLGHATSTTEDLLNILDPTIGFLEKYFSSDAPENLS